MKSIKRYKCLTSMYITWKKGKIYAEDSKSSHTHKTLAHYACLTPRHWELVVGEADYEVY